MGHLQSVEDPRGTIHYLVSNLVSGVVVVALVALAVQDYFVLINGLIGIAALCVVWLLLGLIQALMFAPFFWLMARLSKRKGRQASVDHKS